MKKLLIPVLLASSFLGGTAFASDVLLPLQAASSAVVTPDSGMWLVSAELNGKPGRGFQIDTQGDTLILSFYGYRADGTATFYLASGKFTKDGFVAPLMEYRDGTAFGQPLKDGREIGSAGEVRVQFSESARGTITLPGEEPKAISRFVFADVSNKFQGRTFSGSAVNAADETDRRDVTINFWSVQNGNFGLTLSAISQGGRCTLTGTYEQRGNSLDASGTYVCNQTEDGTFSATDVAVDAFGNLRGRIVSTTNATREIYTDYLIGR